VFRNFQENRGGWGNVDSEAAGSFMRTRRKKNEKASMGKGKERATDWVLARPAVNAYGQKEIQGVQLMQKDRGGTGEQ